MFDILANAQLECVNCIMSVRDYVNGWKTVAVTHCVCLFAVWFMTNLKMQSWQEAWGLLKSGNLRALM